MIEIDAPYFEDLSCGLQFGAPAVTLTQGHAVHYQATFGDRLPLPLDHPSSRAVTGSDLPLAHPLLAINIAIGQSTWASQRVKANLFYRGLALLRPVFIGDTLRTMTRVVALRRNRPQRGRAPTGMAGLEVVTRNQNDEEVLHFWRCPMLLCRDARAAGESEEGDFDGLGETQRETTIPPWRFNRFPAVQAVSEVRPEAGSWLQVGAWDTVTGAPEFVRLTLNMAMAHTDIRQSHLGARLVYGGHTISTCFAQLTRALPKLITLVSWEQCNHVAPVTEGDRLRSEFRILSVDRRDLYEVVKVQAHCFASRGEPEAEATVLEWIFTVLNSSA